MPALPDLVARLTATPVRRGSILDVPFSEYVAHVTRPDVAKVLDGYARSHTRPTLRSVLMDSRLARWIELASRIPVWKRLEHELALVSGIVDEEHILDDASDANDDGEPPTPAPQTRRRTSTSAAPPIPAPRAPAPRPEPEPDAEPEHLMLLAWAAEIGISARLRDPAPVVTRLLPPALRNLVGNAYGTTVADLLDLTSDLSPNLGFARVTAKERVIAAAAAKAYVIEAGDRQLADRAEGERIAALRYEPAGDGAQSFLAAVDAAPLRETKPAASRGMILTSITLEHAPTRLVGRLSLVRDRDGRERTVTITLGIDDWRAAPLPSRIRSDGKEGRTVEASRVFLRGIQRVLRDPRHPHHGALLAYLNEPPWTRVLTKLAAAVATSARATLPTEAPSVVEWIVTKERNLRILPFVSAGGGRVGASLGRFDPRSGDVLDLIVAGQLPAATPRDEAVARALWVAPIAYHYGYQGYPAGRAADLEARERSFRALALLAGQPNVRGPRDAPLRVVSGVLGVELDAADAGHRFAFAVDGEPIEAHELRESLDVAGFLLHVDLPGGRVLLAHVGTPRARILLALASETAVFPASSASDLVERVIELGALVPITLPASLAGEPIVADARPVIRVVREGADALTIAWAVRPIAGGPTHPPGEGPSQILQQVGGRAAFAARSFAEERTGAELVRAGLPGALATGPLAPMRWEGMEKILAVIAALRAAAEAGTATIEWPKSLPRVIGDARWSKLRVQVSAERDWFGVKGGVEVEGVTITLEDLLAARRRGDRFVTVGPDKLVALEDELRARLEDLEAITRPVTKGRALASAAAPALTDLLASRTQLDAAPAFWSLLARIDAASASDPRLPRGFSKILRGYQVDGFRWMSRLAAWGAGACLADEMGLGKTVQTIALLVSRSKEGPALVVAPTSVGPNWLAELERFAPSLNAILHRGSGRAATLAKLGPGDILVTSYDVLARDEEALAPITFATLVLDEAQAIKNGGTTRARAARALSADFRLALTGTPVENRLSELFSLMEFLNPGFFGSDAEFRDRYVVPIERDRDASRSEVLARVVRPFLLRRKKNEVATELPARTEIVRAVERTPGERKLYEAARQLALAALAGADEDARFRVLAEIMRLRRLACHPRLDDDASKVPSSKLDAFLELVGELREGGHRALVFSQFTGHLALVEEALRGLAIRYQYLDGKTPVAERTRRVAAFQAGEGDLFLISLKAGGTGLNLTAADTVIHLDPWWNPAVEDQATDRAHRIGQTRPVTVIRLIAQGTIEEAVMALHADKRQLAESILGGTAASGKLSIAELGALIREGSAA